MISIARTFGAPDSVPAGKPAISASSASSPSRSLPSTLEEMCITWLKRSTTKLSVTFTDPSSATRPTSLRPRSSSIRCSARSFGSPSSSASSAWSSSCVAPRRRVPASGRIVTMPSRRRTRISGLEPDHREAAEIEEEQERRRIDPPQRAVQRERRQRERHREALARHDLEGVAGGDVLLRRSAPRPGTPPW